MIGIVLVSHSASLAEATAELARQMAGDDPPPLRIAAGTDDGGLGTDAVAIAAAIDALAPDVDGVLVIPDLGSAVLSAGLALELRGSAVPVVVGDGPFVEGATVAVVTAAGGADLDVVARAAADALQVKRQGDTVASGPAPSGSAVSGRGTDDRTGPAPSGSAPSASGDDALDAEIVLPNPQGLHARPAAVLARAVAARDAAVTLTDLDNGRGPADAASVLAVLALGAVGGHALRVTASGVDARATLDAVVALVEDGFGETA